MARIAMISAMALARPHLALAQTARLPPLAELAPRHATFLVDQGQVLANFAFDDVFDEAVKQKLSNGPSSTIVMRAFVVRQGETTPVAIALQQCVVNYDLWNEVFRVRLTNTKTADATPRSVVNIAGVIRICGKAQDLPIATRSALRAGVPHLLEVFVDVNPVSDEVRQQMKQWLQRPIGAPEVGPGDALFTAFVALLVRDVGGSDKTVQFRTQETFTP